MRTCTGCRQTAPQRELVRLAFDGPRLVIDPTSEPISDPISHVHATSASGRMRRLTGRGAYVHAKVGCVTVAGLSRSFRRQVSAGDVARIVLKLAEGDRSRAGGEEPGATLSSGNPGQMSPTHDNWGDQPRRNASQNDPGLEDGDTVEMPPRSKAKDDRSEDARL